jgi:hypothetical protein
MIDRIPNEKYAYPRPGSDDEAAAIDGFGPDVMTQALFTFGPDNTGAAIAALCVALGTLHRMLPPVARFYGTPHGYADACRKMILDVVLADDEPDK